MQVRSAYASVLLIALALLAVWCVGLLAREYWRPDEPREAALAHSMVEHPERALPTLGGRTFAEKPPLTYWLAARSIREFGSSAAATRAPQLLYALIAFLAIVALARAAGGTTAGWVAGMVFGTFALAYQTQIWLASDALLIAGVSMALLGMYRGLTAPHSGSRLRWYLLMHVGLTVAFFAKSFAAWLVPATAFLTFVLWERRWRELLRWELWAGALIPALSIAAWVRSVAAEPDGAQHLRVLFWNNLVGRAMSVDSEARYAYSGAHRNWPGKYLVELSVYLLPWTVVGFAALKRAWRKVRNEAPQRSAWRFGVCASLPSLVVLSVAATARGIYATPSLIGIAILIGLWATDVEVAPARATHRILSWSGFLVAAISCILLVATLVLRIVTGGGTWIAIVSVTATAIGVLAGLKLAMQRRTLPPADALRRLGLTYALVLSLGALSLFFAFNRLQDLSRFATGTDTALAHRPLVLWHPDETTLAWVTLYLRAKPQRVFYGDDTDPGDELAALAAYIESQPDARVLALAPRKRWHLATWMRYLRSGMIPQTRPSSPDFDLLLSKANLGIEYQIEQPGGRRYVLLGYPALAPPRS